MTLLKHCGEKLLALDDMEEIVHYLKAEVWQHTVPSYSQVASQTLGLLCKLGPWGAASCRSGLSEHYHIYLCHVAVFGSMCVHTIVCINKAGDILKSFARHLGMCGIPDYMALMVSAYCLMVWLPCAKHAGGF